MPPVHPDVGEAARIEVLCLRPIHHAMEYAAVFRLLEDLRAQAPAARLSLRLRSALKDDAPFSALPADRIGRFSEPDDLSRLGPDAVCVLVGDPDEAERLVREQPGLRLAGIVPLDERSSGPESPACAAAAGAFHAALAAASPLWRVAAGVPPPESPRRVLVHQSRFHVGDTLWLTPLLRVVRDVFPAVEVTVVAGRLAVPVLSRSPHVSELVVWDPAGGEGERRRVLSRLSESRFDAALFALARRDKSRWLAEAAATAGVPWRVNLEYFDSPEDPEDSSLFTHEGWFFWGTLPSPKLLLHALSPWISSLPEDRRAEMPVQEAERAEAARVLTEAGVGSRPFTVLAPAGHSSDRWPPERFAELGVRLSKEWGHFLFIEGAPSDEPLLREVERFLERLAPGERRWRIGTHPLGVLTALLERASLLVTNDSAPVHVAEAAGAPTLYFAQREKLIHSHPAGERAWALFDERENRPAEISVDQAWEAIRRMRRRGLLRTVSGLAPDPAAC